MNQKECINKIKWCTSNSHGWPELGLTPGQRLRITELFLTAAAICSQSSVTDVSPHRWKFPGRAWPLGRLEKHFHSCSLLWLTSKAETWNKALENAAAESALGHCWACYVCMAAQVLTWRGRSLRWNWCILEVWFREESLTHRHATRYKLGLFFCHRDRRSRCLCLANVWHRRFGCSCESVWRSENDIICNWHWRRLAHSHDYRIAILYETHL